MHLSRALTLAAAVAMIGGAAYAQEAAPAQAADAAEAVEAPPAPPSAAAQAFRPLPTTGAADLAATLEASGQFTKFLAAADKAGLTPVLKGDRPLTLFVPTDLAIEGSRLAGAENMEAAQLQPLLLYHVYGNRIAPDQVEGKKGPVATASQQNVEVDGSVTPMKINDSVVVQADVPASNGVIYVLDKALTPPA